MSTKLQKTRAEIATVKAEIANVGAAALDAAGISRRVDAWLAEQSKAVAEHFTDLADGFASESPRGGDAWPLFTERLKHRPEIAVALQVHFQRDGIRRHLVSAAEASVQDRPRVANHAEEVGRLKAHLLALERAEEAEIERLEAAGETVYRRSAMDPRAILGLSA